MPSSHLILCRPLLLLAPRSLLMPQLVALEHPHPRLLQGVFVPTLDHPGDCFALLVLALLGPSLSPRVCSYSCSLSWWCHPTISSSVAVFSCPQSFPASGSFPMSQRFAAGGQSIGVSASVSVLPMNIQGWFTSGLRSKNYAFFALLNYFLFLNINYIWHKLIC